MMAISKTSKNDLQIGVKRVWCEGKKHILRCVEENETSVEEKERAIQDLFYLETLKQNLCGSAAVSDKDDVISSKVPNSLCSFNL